MPPIVIIFLIFISNGDGYKVDPYNISVTSPFYEASKYSDDFEKIVILIHHQYCGNYFADCPESSLKRENPNVLCRTCFCDISCVNNQNCCPSMAFQYNGLYTEPVGRICISSDISPRKSPSVPHYSIIDSCLYSDRHNTWKTRCENSTGLDPMSRIPTMGWSDATNIDNYKNMWCAGCNGVKRVQPWGISIVCDSRPDIFLQSSSETAVYKAAMNTSDCIFEVFSYRDSIECHPYDSKLIHTCNVSGLWSEYDHLVNRACLSENYKVPVKKIYYNVFCYVCNSNLTWADLLLELPHTTKVEAKPTAMLETLPLTIKQMKMEPISTEICFENSTFIDRKDKCIDIRCSIGRIFTGAACESQFHSNMYGYEVCLVLVSEHGNISNAADEFSAVSLSISGVLWDLLGFSTKLLQSYDIDTLICDGEVSYQQQVRFLMFSNSTMRQDWLDIFFNEALMNIQIKIPSTCGQFQPRNEYESSCVIEKSPWISKNRTYALDDVTLLAEQVIYVPFTRLISCCQVILGRDEISFDKYKNIVIHNSLVKINNSEYMLHDNGSVTVCLQDFVDTFTCQDDFPGNNRMRQTPMSDSKWIRESPSIVGQPVIKSNETQPSISKNVASSFIYIQDFSQISLISCIFLYEIICY